MDKLLRANSRRGAARNIRAHYDARVAERHGCDQHAEAYPFGLPGETCQGGEGFGGVRSWFPSRIEVVGTGEGDHSGLFGPAGQVEELVVGAADLGLGHEGVVHGVRAYRPRRNDFSGPEGPLGEAHHPRSRHSAR